MTGSHAATSSNLAVLGYLRTTGAAGWHHGLIYVFGYQAFKDVINAEPWAMFWLTAVVALIVYAARRNGIHTWFDRDGKRSQDFRPDRRRYPFRLYFVSIERDALLTEFQTERIRDPKLGELRCALGEDAPIVYAGNRIVFRVMSKSLFSSMTGTKAIGWLAEYRVEADPGLDPDTVEYLVEKFAIMRDEAALNLRLKARQLEIDRDRARAVARA